MGVMSRHNVLTVFDLDIRMRNCFRLLSNTFWQFFSNLSLEPCRANVNGASQASFWASSFCWQQDVSPHSQPSSHHFTQGFSVLGGTLISAFFGQYWELLCSHSAASTNVAQAVERKRPRLGSLSIWMWRVCKVRMPVPHQHHTL